MQISLGGKERIRDIILAFSVMSKSGTYWALTCWVKTRYSEEQNDREEGGETEWNKLDINDGINWVNDGCLMSYTGEIYKGRCRLMNEKNSKNSSVVS